MSYEDALHTITNAARTGRLLEPREVIQAARNSGGPYVEVDWVLRALNFTVESLQPEQVPDFEGLIDNIREAIRRVAVEGL